jgi:hypothetical protein
MKKLNKPQNFNKNFDTIIKALFFTLFFSWILFNTFILHNSYSDFFAVTLAITPLLGSIYALNRSKDWGFYKSTVGLSLISLSLGLFMWFLGQAFYFLDSKIPESLNIYEFFFIFIDPLYLIGLYFIANSIGTFKYLKANLSLIILPILIFILNVLTASYLNKGDFFEIILNMKVEDTYIFGSIVLATFTISILAFSKKLGGIYHKALILILIGILFQYVGDNLFAFFESQQANGSLADLFFFISISWITYGIYKLDPTKLNA